MSASDKGDRKPGKSDRETRLKQALRANLRRRKQAAPPTPGDDAKKTGMARRDEPPGRGGNR